MPGRIFEAISLGPNWVGEEGDIYVGCTITGPATFLEGSLFDGCQLAGSSGNIIQTGKGNVFGNTTAPCTFSSVHFGDENVLHENWVDSGDNVRGTDGNYGEAPVDGFKQGIIKTNQPCAVDTGSSEGFEVKKLCLGGEKSKWKPDVQKGDRKDGMDSDGGSGSSTGSAP